jgi:Ricin-type beta-trefoil lectin domain-like
MRFIIASLLIGIGAGCAADDSNELSESDSDVNVAITLPAALGGGVGTTHLVAPGKPSHSHGTGIPLPISAGSTTVRVRADAPLVVPASVDLSGDSPPVGDQGDTGSCQSWAPGYTAMGWWANHVGLNNAKFSAMYIYSQLVHGNCDNGNYVENALAIMTKQGVETTSDYEPMQQALDCATQPNALQQANAANFKISGYSDLDLSGGTRAAIENALAAGKPAILSIMDYPEFDNASATNYLVGPPVAGDVTRGGHAITAFAYDANGVWIENQWGTAWGSNGWAELSWAFVSGSFNNTANVGDVATIDGLALSCADSNSSCSWWAQNSQCQENPDYMLTNCCASCASSDLSYQTYSFETAVQTTSCLDVWQSGTANATKLDEYTCNGTDAQAFTVIDGGHGVIHLYNPNSGKCADDLHDDLTNGAEMDIYHCNGTAAQSYTTTWNADGSFTFQQAGTSSCIDVDHQETADDTKVQMWTCNGTVAQRWFPAAM